MSTDNDVARSLRSWLREERHEDADRVLDAVFDQVPATPQRRPRWSARRFFDMNNIAKFAIAATAVALVAVVGIYLMLSSGGVGGPTASTSATPVATPESSPSPTPNIEGLEIGRHSVTVDGVGFSFEVTTKTANGWAKYDSVYLGKSIAGPQGAEGMIFWAGFPDSAHADPCASLLTPPVGPSAADLAATVSTTPGTTLVSGPSDVSIGGHKAKRVVLTVRQNVGCQPGFFYTWQYPAGGPFWGGIEVGDTVTVWIVEMSGTRLFIEGVTHEFTFGPGSHAVGPELGQEIQQIVDSIRFD
jgi:hypothetical protein